MFSSVPQTSVFSVSFVNSRPPVLGKLVSIPPCSFISRKEGVLAVSCSREKTRTEDPCDELTF